MDKMRFIEQLRQNPALAAVREQLREVLVERVEMCGVPRASTGIDGALLLNKTAMQQMQRKAYVQVGIHGYQAIINSNCVSMCCVFCSSMPFSLYP